jgi:hypothetical protein
MTHVFVNGSQTKNLWSKAFSFVFALVFISSNLAPLAVFAHEDGSETDTTFPVASIGVGNGNTPENTGPVHEQTYSGIVPVYATFTDEHPSVYHFRVIADGGVDGFTCEDLFAPENQDYNKCGFLYNKSIYITDSFTNLEIASIDTARLGPNGKYWFIFGAKDIAQNRTNPNYLLDARVSIMTDNGDGDDDPPTDVCQNLDGVQATVPVGYHLSEGQCVADESIDGPGDGDQTPPTDVCSNLDGVQESVPTGYHMSDGQCVVNENTGGGDFVTPPPSPSPSPAPQSPGGGGGGFVANGPILGAFGVNFPGDAGTGSKGKVLGAQSCSVDYINSYIRPGGKNDPEDVKKLQTFLNELFGLTIPVTGFYGPRTIAAVRTFQIKHSADVLRPWVLAGLHNDENTPTGFVYKTTKRMINILKCPDMTTPIPQLP